MKYNFIFLLVTIISVANFSQFVAAESLEQELSKALKGSHREPGNRQRDTFRHPQQTLTFLGLKPDMTVVEISPGRGWYTEVLAPILRKEGQLYIAGFSKSENELEWKRNMAFALDKKLAKYPQVYNKVIIRELMVPEQIDIAPENSADMILTFRNVHNWMKGGYAKEMFQLFAKIIKQDGILGIVEHRALPGTSVNDMIASGYVTEDYIIKLAQEAGFELQARSDINANSNDTTQHPKGVWTLPPTLRLCKSIKDDSEKEQCINEYTKVGESDRMTLRFRKF